MLLLLLLWYGASALEHNCNVTLSEEHAHFTAVTDQNVTRECWLDLPEGPDLFLDIERYSGRNRVDEHAQLNLSLGTVTVSLNNGFVQSGQHRCAVPTQTRLEKTIWLWLHFDNSQMTVQVSPANTAFFGHCFTVAVVRPSVMHIVGRTRTGMEQVVRGIHVEHPEMHDPGQTVVMRKTIHELERRLHILEQQHERFADSVNGAHRHHLEKHRENRDMHRENADTQEDHRKFVQQQMHDIVLVARPWWQWWLWCSVVLTMVVILYRLWVLGFRQDKLTRFKL